MTDVTEEREADATPTPDEIAVAKSILAKLPEAERAAHVAELAPENPAAPTEGMTPEQISEALEKGELNDYLASR